jgi:hypothetical protein
MLACTRRDVTPWGGLRHRDPGQPLGIPDTMLGVPAVVVAAALALGLITAARTAAGRAADSFTDHIGYVAEVTHTITTVPSTTPPPHGSTVGVLLGLLSTILAATLARTAVHRSTWHRLAGYCLCADCTQGTLVTTSPSRWRVSPRSPYSSGEELEDGRGQRTDMEPSPLKAPCGGAGLLRRDTPPGLALELPRPCARPRRNDA